MIYLHESYHAVPSIPVDFQYSRILVLYSSNTMHYIRVCYSSKPAFNIPVIVPVVFQYSNIVVHYKIPVLPWLIFPIPLFLFQLLYWRVFYFHNFHPACFSASPIEIFIVSFQYTNLYYFRTHSIIRHPSFCFQVSRFHVACLNFFRYLLPLPEAPSSRWHSQPIDRSSAFRRSCYSHLPPISSTANLASL